MEFEGKRYRINGIGMNVVITGQGPDVLLVHGFPDSIAVWRHPASGDIVLPDLRWVVGGGLVIIFLLVGWMRAARRTN